jgi:hypothetical protein
MTTEQTRQAFEAKGWRFDRFGITFGDTIMAKNGMEVRFDQIVGAPSVTEIVLEIRH